MKRGIKVQYHDNHVPYLKIHDIKMRSRKLTVELLKKQDFVIVVTDHSYLDYKKIAGNSKLILDTRNVFWKNKIKGENIIKL